MIFVTGLTVYRQKGKEVATLYNMW